MHRNNATSGVGALASLTANYTDSDASDGSGSEDEDNIHRHHHYHHHRDHQRHQQQQLQVGNILTKTTTTEIRVSSPPEENIEELEEDENNEDEEDIEMGHITDEEQSNHSVELVNEALQETAIDDVQIPLEPMARCPNHLQEKFAQYYERMLREGLDLNATIQNQKQFRNPSIYEKLIQFCQIDELGTNYTPAVYDPSQFVSGPFYEELAKAQKTEMDKRMKEQKDRTKIEFVSGTVKKSSQSDGNSTDESKKRKSKWDIGAAPISSLAKPTTTSGQQQPGLVPLTAVPSGTKAMVISAFGTIAKKTKQ